MIPSRTPIACACALLVAACGGEPSRTEHAPAQPDAPAAASPRADAKLADPEPPAPQPASPIAVRAPDPPWDPLPSATPADAFTGPFAATAIEAGVLLVWARPAAVAGKSEILATLLDDAGIERGAPKLLRTTSGEVIGVAVHRRDGDAWIAWLSLLASDPQPRSLIAAAPLAANLAWVGAPITLSRFTDPEGPAPDGVGVLDLADGSGVVAAAGPRTTCTDVAEGKPTKCPGFELFWVRDDGTFDRAAHIGVDGGDSAVASLVDVGTGALLDVYAWHGGPTFASAYAPYGAVARGAPFPLVTCRPPFGRAWTGTELVTLCAEDYLDEGERCPFPDADEDMCPRVHAVKADGTLVTPKGPPELAAMTAQTQRCKDGRPVLDVAWKGGTITLDPQAPGASVQIELGLWTGRHAIRLHDGIRERWSCTAKGELVLDESIETSIAYAHPTAALAKVPLARYATAETRSTPDQP